MKKSRSKMNAEGDIVLIHYQDKPTVYARIEHIEVDVIKDWYQITLLLLTIPAGTKLCDGMDIATIDIGLMFLPTF